MSAKQGRVGAQVHNRFLVCNSTVDDDDVINKVLNTRGLRQEHLNAW
jgi:hypothetical protein